MIFETCFFKSVLKQKTEVKTSFHIKFWSPNVVEVALQSYFFIFYLRGFFYCNRLHSFHLCHFKAKSLLWVNSYFFIFFLYEKSSHVSRLVHFFLLVALNKILIEYWIINIFMFLFINDSFNGSPYMFYKIFWFLTHTTKKSLIELFLYSNILFLICFYSILYALFPHFLLWRQKFVLLWFLHNQCHFFTYHFFCCFLSNILQFHC